MHSGRESSLPKCCYDSTHLIIPQRPLKAPFEGLRVRFDGPGGLSQSGSPPDFGSGPEHRQPVSDLIITTALKPDSPLGATLFEKMDRLVKDPVSSSSNCGIASATCLFANSLLTPMCGSAVCRVLPNLGL